MPIRSIACATGLASTTVGRAIGALADLGLVERRQRGDRTVWGISLETAIRDDVRAPPTGAAKALCRREFSESVRDGLRRIDLLRREAKRIIALAGERRERIAVLVRATKAQIAELIGDPQ
ncbi:MAG: hypothetical protein OXN84_17775 [Albidovulum sp.]|nr:hypothetical protein [Albidovulum sp.]MDE0254124.1 hypothetical protein [Rhodospirillaceae bacterium]